MDNISELNELIYAGAKLVFNKISVPLRNPNRNTKPGWEIRQEGHVKKLRQQTKMLWKKKYSGICWNEKTKAKQVKNLIIQHEAINQKILAKEGRLKRYRAIQRKQVIPPPRKRRKFY